MLSKSEPAQPPELKALDSRGRLGSEAPSHLSTPLYVHWASLGKENPNKALSPGKARV